MTEFMEFESWEDAVSFMAEQTDRANERLAPEQVAVTYGDCWVRFYDIAARTLIFGRITTLDYWDEKIATAKGEDRQEWMDEKVSVAESHERGYMYGKAYSVIEPDGEWGSTHRANLWPIPEWLFEQARAAGWRMDDLDEQGKDGLSQVWLAYRAHNLADGG
jgi:hypothetical protein